MPITKSKKEALIYFEALERSKPPYDYEKIESKNEEAFYRIVDTN